MIFSIHIPKTAGTTFRFYLASWLPPEKIACLYGLAGGKALAFSKGKCAKKIERGSVPANLEKDIPRLRKEKCKVIHGHFTFKHISTFLEAGDRVVVWLRDPKKRLISHYKVELKKCFLESGLAINEEIRAEDIPEQFHPVNLLSGPYFDNLCYKSLSNGTQTIKEIIENCFWIGFTEDFEQDIQIFSKMTGIGEGTNGEGTNLERRNPARITLKDIPQGFFDCFESKLGLDYEIYRAASEKKRLLQVDRFI